MAPQASSSKSVSKQGNRDNDNSTTKYTNWSCHICGVANNWGWRSRCRNCDAYPSPAARRPLHGAGAPGVHRGANNNISNAVSVGGGGSRGGGGTTLAERQLQQQRQDQRRQQQARDLADARRKTEALREENKRLQRQITAARASKSGDADAEDMDGVEGPVPLTEDQRQIQIGQVRDSLPYFETRFGKESEEYLRAASELETLLRASRDSKPYKTHRAYLERRLERLQKQQAADTAKAEETEQAMEALRSTLGEVREAINEREKTILATENELKELLRTAIGGPEAEADAGQADAHSSWRTVVSAASSLAGRPGVPADWANQLQGLFNQLATVVQAMEGAAATHDASMQAAHDEQMRLQQHEQQQLQAQLMQQQALLHGQAPPPLQAQPRTDVVAPLLLASALPNPPHQQLHQTSGTAEDMVARAMALSPAHGAQDHATAADAAPRATDGEDSALPNAQAESKPTAPALDATRPNNPVPVQPPGDPADNADDDSDDSDGGDDESVAMEVAQREGESTDQHASRVRQFLKDKLLKYKAAKANKEDKKGNKAREGREARERARPKPTLRK